MRISPVKLRTLRPKLSAKAFVSVALLLLMLSGTGCSPGVVLNVGWGRSRDMNIKRAWSAQTGKSIQRLWDSYLYFTVPNCVTSNTVRIGENIYFAEVRPRISAETYELRFPVYITCRRLSDGRLTYRKEFRPQARGTGREYCCLLHIKDYLFVGHFGTEDEAFENSVGICWDIRKGQMLENTRLTREQLPKAVSVPNSGSFPFATDGEYLYLGDIDGRYIHIACLEVPSWSIKWYKQISFRLPEKLDRANCKTWRLDCVNGLLIAYITVEQEVTQYNSNGGIVIAAVRAETGELVWQKTTPMFPTYMMWGRGSPVVIGKTKLYLPTDTNVIEAWDLASGKKAWARKLPAKIASPITFAENTLGLLTRKYFCYEAPNSTDSPKSNRFRPIFVSINAETSKIIKAIPTSIDIVNYQAPRLAHLPGWFLLFRGGSAYGFPVDPNSDVCKWKCWAALILGVIPYDLDRNADLAYIFGQVDKNHVLVYSAPGVPVGKLTMFAHSPR